MAGFLRNQAKIFMKGPFNALSHVNVNSFSVLKPNDALNKLEEQILDYFCFVDFAFKNDSCKKHIITNNTKYFRASIVFYLNFH